MGVLTVLFLVLLCSILSHSRLSLSYAAIGLELWFQKMIPSLLPFMILSGIMVRMKLTDKVAMLIYPIVRPLYKVRKNVCYAMLMGFLCGFPMGARVVDDLYQRQMITKREAEYLLAFCNNIGPVYFCSFALPLLGRKLVLPYLFGMYGIPLLYGLALRYTRFRDLSLEASGRSRRNAPLPCSLAACSISKAVPNGAEASQQANLGEKLLREVNSSIQASVQSMLSLGGYMILFNLLNLVPHILMGKPIALLSPLLEITSGLQQLWNSLPSGRGILWNASFLWNAALPRDTIPALYSLLTLSFGGLSCIAQTYSCIDGSDLSIGAYVYHKITLAAMTALYYLGWYLLLPGSFLR